MPLLIIFAFASGLVTALTPCVLPILPIILSTGAQQGRRRPLGIVLGLTLSFTFFTLFLTTIVKALNAPPDLLRSLAIFTLFFFGLTMLVPRLGQFFEQVTSKITNRVGARFSNKEGFIGGLVMGTSLGLLWTPCAGPILASVITLAATSTITLEAILITFAYACGSATVLLLIAYGGKTITNKLKTIGVHTVSIQISFGVIMILMSLAIFFNADRRFQTYIIQNLPSWALTPLATIESNEQVSSLLSQLANTPTSQQAIQLDTSRLLSNYGNAPEISGISQWFNTENKQYSIKELKGKIIIIDFWTYSCVNCIRTLPYLRTWHEKYADKGLVILGIHSPEFAFERVPSNVQKAITDFEIKYPVALDNEFKTWQAYSNHYWPAKYLIDTNGVIRYRHFGEGRYEDTERAIQLLLSEAGQQADLEISKATNIQAQTNRTPETYMGYARLDPARLIVSNPLPKDTFHTFPPMPKLSPHQFALSGQWKITQEYAEANPGAKIQFQFYSNEANLVMSNTDKLAQQSANTAIVTPAAVQDNNIPKGTNFCTNEVCIGASELDQTGVPVKVHILSPMLINTNNDLREGIVYVNQSKLYRLVELSKTSENIIELEFPEGGVRLYAWTF